MRVPHPRLVVPVLILLLAAAGVTAWLVSRGEGSRTGASRPTPSAATTTTAPVPTTTTVPVVPTSRMVLFGDGVAAVLGDALTAETAKQGVLLAAWGRPGCGMTNAPVLYAGTDRLIDWTPVCASSFEQFTGTVLDQVNPDAVLWLSTWETGDHLVSGQPLRFGTPADDAWLLAQMDAFRARVVAHGARLVMVTNAPIATTSPYYPSDNVTRFPHLNDLYRQFADEHPTDVAVVDLAGLVCPGGGPCPTTVDGVTLRNPGDVHYLPSGAAWIAPRLIPLVYGSLHRIDTVRSVVAMANAGRS